MSMFGLDIGQVIQGGSGLIALYLTLQIKRVIDNHEARITTLESGNAVSRRSKRSRGPRR